MQDIFLSYAEEDRETARKITAHLESMGWSVWWDREIPTGRTWRDVIEQALANMRCMVVLWSSSSVKSDWVKEEADEGRLQQKLLPVLIESVRPPLGFRDIQAADLIHWDGSNSFPGLQHLITDLESMLGKPQPVAVPLQRTEPQNDRAIPDQPKNLTPPETVLATRSNFSNFSWLTEMSWRPWAALAAVVMIGAVVIYFVRSNTNPAVIPPASTVQAPEPASQSTSNTAPEKAYSNPPISEEVSPGTDRASAPNAAIPGRGAKIDGSNPVHRTKNTNRIADRCNDLLNHVQLGEPLSEVDRAWFEKQCNYR